MNDFYQVSLKVILRNGKGEVLFLKNPNSGGMANMHDLPGGRIDVLEFTTAFEKIIQREIKEELGNVKYSLKTNPVALGRHVYNNKHKADVKLFYVFFEAEYKSGKIVISDEHVNYEWVDFKKITLKKYFVSGLLEGMKMYLKNCKK